LISTFFWAWLLLRLFMLRALRTRRNGVSVGETCSADMPQPAPVAVVPESSLPPLDVAGSSSSQEHGASHSPSSPASSPLASAAARPLFRKAHTHHALGRISDGTSSDVDGTVAALRCCEEPFVSLEKGMPTSVHREGHADELPMLLTSAPHRTITCDKGSLLTSRAADDDQPSLDRQVSPGSEVPQRRVGAGRRVSVALHDEVMGAPLRSQGGRRVTLSLKDETMEDIRSALRMDGSPHEASADASRSLSPGSPGGRGGKPSRAVRNGPGIYRVHQRSTPRGACDNKDAADKAPDKDVESATEKKKVAHGSEPDFGQANALARDEDLEQLQRALKELVPAGPASHRSHGARRNAAASSAACTDGSGTGRDTTGGKSESGRHHSSSSPKGRTRAGRPVTRQLETPLLEAPLPAAPASSLVPSPKNTDDPASGDGTASSPAAPSGGHTWRVPRAVRSYLVQLGSVRGGEGTQQEEHAHDQRSNRRHVTESANPRPQPSPRGLCEELARVDRANAMAAERSCQPAQCIRRLRRSSTT